MRIFTTAILAVFAVIAVFGIAHRAEATGGSYAQSCQNTKLLSNGSLFSQCQDMSGNYHDTTLPDVAGCVGDILNNNGVLQCNRGGTPPNGSYLNSCINSTMSGGTLHSDCRDLVGNLHQTHLDNVAGCVGDILNNDGTLQCNRGGTPPNGSYLQSCINSTVSGGDLHSDCKNNDGHLASANLPNYKGCIGDISNVNGTLRCARGTAGAPGGSYLATCTNVTFKLVNGDSVLGASCTAFNGSQQMSTLDLGMCRKDSDLYNVDGALTCFQGNADPPSGKYSKTCRSVKTTAKPGQAWTTLQASCRTTGGGYLNTTLQNQCPPNADVYNSNGRLGCSNGIGAPLPPPPPPGSKPPAPPVKPAAPPSH